MWFVKSGLRRRGVSLSIHGEQTVSLAWGVEVSEAGEVLQLAVEWRVRMNQHVVVHVVAQDPHSFLECRSGEERPGVQRAQGWLDPAGHAFVQNVENIQDQTSPQAHDVGLGRVRWDDRVLQVGREHDTRLLYVRPYPVEDRIKGEALALWNLIGGGHLTDSGQGRRHHEHAD